MQVGSCLEDFLERYLAVQSEFKPLVSSRTVTFLKERSRSEYGDGRIEM